MFFRLTNSDFNGCVVSKTFILLVKVYYFTLLYAAELALPR